MLTPHNFVVRILVQNAAYSLIFLIITDKQSLSQIVEWCIFATTATIVILRLAVRSWTKMWSFWLSEMFIVVALLFFLGLVAGDTVVASLGYNAFDDTRAQEENAGYARWKIVADILYDSGFYFPRFSLLAFYDHLFPRSQRRLRMLMYAVMVYTVCSFLSAICIAVFWCNLAGGTKWSNGSGRDDMRGDPIPTYVNWAVGMSSELMSKSMSMQWKLS
jgi:hypothetical protein